MNAYSVETFPRFMEFSWEFSGTNSKIKIEIPIFCPDCGSDHIWKAGIDTAPKNTPQRLYCHNCGRNFYPHTSKFFMGQAQELIIDIIRAALERGHKITDIAKQYNIDPSVVSEIIGDFLEYMAKIGDKARNLVDIPGAKAIFMDEKFLKIGGKKYLFIIALNEKGERLAYELSEDRSAETIKGVFLKAIGTGLPPDLLVSDGHSGYRKALKLAGLSITHVEHIHKPPYGRVIITRIENTEDEIKETSIGTTNDIFVNNGVNIGMISVKTTKKKKK